jgi:hypothetical protein
MGGVNGAEASQYTEKRLPPGGSPVTAAKSWASGVDML